MKIDLLKKIPNKYLLNKNYYLEFIRFEYISIKISIFNTNKFLFIKNEFI